MSGQFEQVVLDDERTSAIITVPKQVYSKSAVLKACYWLGRDLHFQIEEQETEFKIIAGLRVSQPSLAQPKVKKIDDFLPDLFEALVDHQLRVEIQEETTAVRELIIAKAFSESGVLEDSPPGTFEDPVAARTKGNDGLVQIVTEDGK